MLDRLLIVLAVLGSLAIVWAFWQCCKLGLARSIRPVEGAAGVPTLLYFAADYCAPCKFQQTPIVERVAAKLGDAVVVRNVDVSQQPELASQYRVLTVPTTVVLDRQGQVAHINYGVTDQARLEAQLR